MQTQQMQERRVRTPEKSRGKLYFYGGLVSFMAALFAYAGFTVKYQFLTRDKDLMGTFFYSWRVIGADKEMFTKTLGKLSKDRTQKEKTEYLAKHYNDGYTEHAPRSGEHHMTMMALPNMDMFVTIRDKFVKMDGQAPKKMSAERREKILKEEGEAKLAKILQEEEKPKTFYMQETSKEKVDKVLRNIYDSLNDKQKEMFKTVVGHAIELFVGMSERKFFFNDKYEIQSEAIGHAEAIVDALKEPEPTDPEFAWGGGNEHTARFMKSRTADGLGKQFFEEMTHGTLNPYFAFAYSRFAYFVLYSTLNVPVIDKTASDNLNASKELLRTLKVANAIAYGFSNSLSEKIGKKVVADNLSWVRRYFFTQEVVDASPEIIELNHRICKRLREVGELVEDF